MTTKTSGPWVDIDLNALCENYRLLDDAAPGAETAAVVKCNAYGVGLKECAEALAKKTNCQTYFVAYPEEGARLRAILKDLAPDATIYIFNGPLQQTMALFEDAKLTPVINSLSQAKAWTAAYPGKPCAVHVDTGMNRLGAPVSAIDEMVALPGLNVGVIMSHLACSSDPAHPKNSEQRDTFKDIAAEFPNAQKSLSASAGILLDASYHFDMTRLGVALYGASPFDVETPMLKRVASLKAPIIQIRDLRPGETVGYGATYIAEKPAVIAAVALGYGDGYPTAGANAGPASINGEIAKIAGRVSMDLISLDVTHFENRPQVGDIAEFFGRDITLFEAASACGTIPYELLTGLGGRVDHRYL